MTMAAHPDSSPTTTNAAPPAGFPGGSAAVSTPAPAAVSTPAPAAPAATAPAAAPTRRVLSADDDSLPDDADGFEISKTAFKKRLERYSRTQLKSLFGTDNPEEILAWKAQNEQFAAAAEQQRLAEMTEADRYKVQYEKEQMAAAHWKTQYETLQESFALREQDRQMTGVAQKYVNPKCMNFLMMEFATHLQGADEKEIGEPQAYADAWFAKYVAENPEFGIGSSAPPAPAAVGGGPPAGFQNVNAGAGVPATPPAYRQVQVPISNGVGGGGRPANAVPTGQLTQKTLAPGLPNSMTDGEAKRWMREHGYNY
jgi:flagellar basal body rod protein FlgB